uniref:Uncharacterized protein n=1 Tax=Trichuris muris TaxID=70415 RepID=A0A5S6QK93_TRIMR
MSAESTEEDIARHRAVVALLREADRGKERAETMGSQGWRRKRLTCGSLRFLHHVTKSASASCSRREQMHSNRKAVNLLEDEPTVCRREEEIKRAQSSGIRQPYKSCAGTSDRRNDHAACKESKCDELPKSKHLHRRFQPSKRKCR